MDPSYYSRHLGVSLKGDENKTCYDLTRVLSEAHHSNAHHTLPPKARKLEKKSLRCTFSCVETANLAPLRIYSCLYGMWLVSLVWFKELS